MLPSPSSVSLYPATASTGVTHERTACPRVITVHQLAESVAGLAPRRPRSSLRAYSSGVDGLVAQLRLMPLTFSVMALISESRRPENGGSKAARSEWSKGKGPRKPQAPRALRPRSAGRRQEWSPTYQGALTVKMRSLPRARSTHSSKRPR